MSVPEDNDVSRRCYDRQAWVLTVVPININRLSARWFPHLDREVGVGTYPEGRGKACARASGRTHAPETQLGILTSRLS
jgi:hypothetical protein